MKATRFLSAGFLLLPALVWAQDREVSLSSFLAKGSERPAGAETAGRTAADDLAAVAGVDNFPIVCASPLVTLLVRPDSPLPPGLQAIARRFAAHPAPGAERIALSRDGRFSIHYSSTPRSSGLLSIDRDRNGSPDLVDRVGEALPVARAYLVSRLGYPGAPVEREPVDVYVDDIGHGLEGYAVPHLESGGLPFIVLDSGLSADRVMPAILHQLAHVSLLSLSPRAPLWWVEASAAYLTLLSTGDLKAHEAPLRARLQNLDRGLGSDDLLLMEGSLLWPLFLAERDGDPAIVRLIWEEMGTQGSDPASATDAVLRRSGRTATDAWREFSAWNLFTGERDDGQHYSMGRSFPAATLQAEGPDMPLQFEPSDDIEPLGFAAFRLSVDSGQGTMDLEVTAEGGRPAADLLVFYRPWGPSPVLVPLTFDASGSARLSVPWGDARAAWIVLRNDALSGSIGSRFEVRARPDPYSPYDLASFTASANGTSMLLEWTTAAEKGLQAWNIYRSETPGGPFTRLNSVAVPAVGDSSDDTGYIFVDELVGAGRRYYYLLEGITNLGLPQRSHVASGRIQQDR